MPKTWIVVAESSRAKIFELNKKNTPLKELQDFIHPASKIHEQKISSDLAGDSRVSYGQGSHKLNSQTSIKKHEIKAFAKTISQYIEKARNKDKFQKLILMSPPSFLGQLRKHLSAETFKRIVSQIDKNLVKHNTHEIQAHLPYHF